MWKINNEDNYRLDLAKKIKKTRNGSFKTKISEVFLSSDKKDQNLESRKKDASKILLDELSSFDWYSDHKNKNILKREKDSSEKYKLILKEDRNNKLDAFKKEHPEFDSFLWNADIISLISWGANIKEIDKNKDEDSLQDLLNIIPKKETYSVDSLFTGAKWLWAKVFFLKWWEPLSEDVRQDLHYADELWDSSVNKNELLL